jgi:intracellular sulfur oxidation DsrE/DsrF family protein
MTPCRIPKAPLLALALALSAPAVLSLVAGPTVAAEPYGVQKVVYHNSGAAPDDADYFKHMLSNVSNHLNAVGDDNLTVVVVSHGDGLELFQRAKTDPDLSKRVDTLRERGVRFLVCANTLHARKISLGDLYKVADEDVVPSGVAEIAHLEQEGYVYLHP